MTKFLQMTLKYAFYFNGHFVSYLLSSKMYIMVMI